MIAWFERRIAWDRQPPAERPPNGILGFYWYHVRQAWPWFGAVLVAGALVAAIEVAMFRYIGSIVDILGHTTPDRVVAEYGTTFLSMLAVVLVARPLAGAFHDIAVRQVLAPPFTALVRWQSHRQVLRQSLSFFQNDFAGRLSSRVMQTAPALRESALNVVDALWFATMYAVSALALFADADLWLALPLAIWLVVYVGLLRLFVPRLQGLARMVAEKHSQLSGRIVDGYTNIMTVKLFAHAEREEAYVREAMVEHLGAYRKQMRAITAMTISVSTANSIMLAATGTVSVLLWQSGVVGLGSIAVATGLAIRLVNMSGWIMWEVAGVFENVGQVQEGIATIARPVEVVDRPEAGVLDVPRGEVRFESVRFHYGRGSGVFDDLTLKVAAGERIGLVGRSGAGKSTLVSLLLRFHDLEGGRVLIDGTDIAGVTQESLRAAIGVVTQDTSLLHRSVRDNVRYGKPDATDAEVRAAADRAHASDFIATLVDPQAGAATTPTSASAASSSRAASASASRSPACSSRTRRS